MSLPPLFIRAPNHLGDGVMALPAVTALAAAAQGCRVAAPAWGEALYRDTGARWVPRETPPTREEVAALLAPSFRAAWQARRALRRVGLASDGRRLLLTDALRSSGGHRREDYAAVAAALGVGVVEAPRFTATEEERAAWVELPEHVGLNPISVSGATVEWPHYAALAGALEEPVRVYCGPGEEARARAAVPGVELLAGLPLGALAGALARCRVLVSNDSGVAHFAAACGVRTVVLFGSTTAARTGPFGCTAVEGPTMDCRPCYRKRCNRGLGCLSAIGPERVLEVLS